MAPRGRTKGLSKGFATLIFMRRTQSPNDVEKGLAKDYFDLEV